MMLCQKCFINEAVCLNDGERLCLSCYLLADEIKAAEVKTNNATK